MILKLHMREWKKSFKQNVAQASNGKIFRAFKDVI